MTQKAQNRKLILQQLLQKSQLFNEYLKNEQNINSILNLNQSKKYQFLQFGKCEINLPQKVKAPPHKFTTNKIMVLTKNKKQALRIKEKYENLQKLRETQALNLQIAESQSQRKSISQYTSRQTRTQIKHFLVGSNTKNATQQVTSSTFTPSNKQQSNPQSYDFMNQPITYQLSPQRKSNITQIKCRTKEFIAKNRSSSAKVRPQFDFFLRYGNVGVGTGQSVERFDGKELVSERRLVMKDSVRMPKMTGQKVCKEQQTMEHQQTLILQQPLTNTTTQPPTILNPQQQPSLQLQPTPLPTSPERRPSSFSIKKHLTNITPSLLINKNYQQKLEQSKKNKINFRRELHKTYKRAFIPPPKISAKAYAVYEVRQEGYENSGKILCTINGKMAQEVASLTKIMTCIVVIEVAERFGRNLDEEKVEIGKFETNITGTSAMLKIGEVYTVQQLLYGLMLPSGNDASLALGVWGGRLLLAHPQTKPYQLTSPTLSKLQAKPQTTRTHDSSSQSSPLYDPTKKYYKKDYIQRFVQEMNTKAQMLNMTRTHYANTHGLVNSENKSAAIDIALLCEYVMANERFAKIVGTRVYESIIKYKEYSPTIDNNTPVVYKPRTIKFQNTHYLLHKKPHQYLGIKTGVTTAAGPCLASYIQNKQTNRKFIIVVLDCKSMMMRFKETEVLKKWLYRQENIPVKVKRVKGRALSLREDSSEIRSELEDGEGVSDGEEDFAEQKCED